MVQYVLSGQAWQVRFVSNPTTPDLAPQVPAGARYIKLDSPSTRSSVRRELVILQILKSLRLRREPSSAQHATDLLHPLADHWLSQTVSRHAEQDRSQQLAAMK